MGGVRGHYSIAAADGALHDSDIDDVVMTGLPGQDADVHGHVLAHRLRVTHAEKTAQAGLSGTSPPGFCQHWGRNRGDDLFGQVTRMQRPHLAVIAFGRDQRASVVGDPAHPGYADLRSAASAASRPREARARAPPFGSSTSGPATLFPS